ncbi:uncharacterized protein [Parasteatoda tepidariorum]|uniref:uncharacterized protein n=1 Tax=Parasteatoda tepidariorum TaxID=114398 RepID=UPI0039BC9CC9
MASLLRRPPPEHPIIAQFLRPSLMAIREAINYAAKQEEQTTIYTDSLSSLHALADPTHKNTIVQDIKHAWRQSISLNWIKAHVGHAGNEEADQLAKEATRLDTIENTTWLTPIQIKSIINNHIMARWKLDWTNSTKGRQTYKFFKDPKTTRMKVNFYTNQFLTGHGVFGTHQARFFRQSSTCTYCNSQQDIHHLIFQCLKFQTRGGNNFHTKTEHQIYSTLNCRSIIKDIIKTTLEDTLNSL